MKPFEEAAPDPREERELEALAEELRAAHADPPLRAVTLERILAHAVPVWSFRRALRQNRLLRAAAAMLVTVSGAIPVLAVVQLLQQRGAEAPELAFELPAPPPAVLSEPVESWTTTPPPHPDLLERLDDSWVVAIERDSRLQAASFRWQKIYPVDAPEAFADFAGADALRAGLALRFGALDAAAVPALAEPAAADAAELWLELERLLAAGVGGMPVDALVTRVRQLWNERPEDRPLLAGWIHLLDGAPVADAAPGLEGAARVSWEAAERRSLLWPAR
jgi:hypothetical protein